MAEVTTPTRVKLDYSPREWQRQCHLARKRFSVFALHRRAGKTELAIMELVEAALTCTRPLGLFLYMAPFLNQAEGIVWRRLKEKLGPLVSVPGAADVNEGDLMVTFKHNGATIQLFGANHPEKIRGMRLDGIVVDEVAQIDPVVWDEIVQPALSDRLGWAIFIGTPHGVNLFSQLFYKAQVDPEWHAAKFTVYETGALDEREVERLRQPDNMTETAFAREYLCDFTASGDDQLISLADAEAAARRQYVDRDVEGAPRIIGVDPARFGDDRSAIVKRWGLQMLPSQTLRGVDNMELAARVAAEINDWKPDAVFVDSGAGAGVIDRLRQLGYVVIEVPFGGKATDIAEYVNRRTEMWFGMRDWLMAGGAIPNEAPLKQELATPLYWFDPAGRKVLEPKEDIKKRLKGDSSSPDIADALALTFAMPVMAAGARGTQTRNEADYQRRVANYDPLAHGKPQKGGKGYDPFAARR